MRELCSYGSVGEPAGNCRLYPDPTSQYCSELMVLTTQPWRADLVAKPAC